MIIFFWHEITVSRVDLPYRSWPSSESFTLFANHYNFFSKMWKQYTRLADARRFLSNRPSELACLWVYYTRIFTGMSQANSCGTKHNPSYGKNSGVETSCETESNRLIKWKNSGELAYGSRHNRPVTNNNSVEWSVHWSGQWPRTLKHTYTHGGLVAYICVS